MAQLITANEVIAKAFVHGNIDPALIKAEFVEICQEEHILPYLGQDMYDALVLENNANVFTGLNETLLDNYIKPALALFVAKDILLHLAVRVTNKGVMVNTSETSQPASREEMSQVVKRYNEQGQTLMDKMERYINDNSSNFPLFAPEVDNNSFIGGIIF